MQDAANTTGNGKALLEVRDLVTHYGDTRVLDGVNVDIIDDEVTVILGGSGCGKTTLMKHMCGLLRASSGHILFEGQDIANLNEDEMSRIQQRFGIAFQSGGLFNSMTVGENVALPLLEYGGMRRGPLLDALVRMKLSLVGLAQAQHFLPAELSGGMKKRAGLARAIALDPPIVFFDEPSAGLDPIMMAGLDELILRMRDVLSITFVVVTHELPSIESIADKVLFLDQGKVLYEGTVEGAKTEATDRVRQFFERRADEFIVQRTL